MKKWLALLLAGLMVLLLAACGTKETEEDKDVILDLATDEEYVEVGGDYHDSYTYETINGNEAMITGFKSDYAPHAVTVPAVIAERPVTAIAAQAFYYKSAITSLTLPEGVTEIGKLAFAGCSQMTSITLPASVAKIGDGAFTGCTALTTLTLPAALTAVGTELCYNCTALTTVALPASLTTIGSRAFMNCTALTTVTGGAAVTEIGTYAFMECRALTAFPFAGMTNLAKIGTLAFSNCAALARPALDASVEVDEDAFYVAPAADEPQA